MKHRKKSRKKPRGDNPKRPHRATGRPRGRPEKYRSGERHGHHRYQLKHGLIHRHKVKRVWLY